MNIRIPVTIEVRDPSVKLIEYHAPIITLHFHSYNEEYHCQSNV